MAKYRMSNEAWFIGSRRRYPTTPLPREGSARVDRLDPAEFLESGKDADPRRLRDFEIEVLERVLARRQE